MTHYGLKLNQNLDWERQYKRQNQNRYKEHTENALDNLNQIHLNRENLNGKNLTQLEPNRKNKTGKTNRKKEKEDPKRKIKTKTTNNR